MKVYCAPVRAEGSRESVALLQAMLDDAGRWTDPARFEDDAPRAWAIAVWKKLAPSGSAVAAQLGEDTPARAAKVAKQASRAAKPKPKPKPKAKAKAKTKTKSRAARR